MKRIIMKAAIAVIAIFAIVSCEDSIVPEVTPTKPVENASLVFTAKTETAATKTALSENGGNFDVVWQSGDQITIVDGESHVGRYSTTSTTTTAEFTYVPESGAEATTSPYKAWYPATIYNGGTPVLPAIQDYVEGNISGSPMYAESGTTALNFKNICGIIRLNISTTQDGKKVRRIILSATQGMSGTISNAATLASDSYVASISGTAGVTLDCGESGIAINGTAKPFHIAVPAGTYTSLDITVETTDGESQTRTSKSGITVVRSGITDITLPFNSFASITNLSASAKANTYIVTSSGTYKFKATVKGNGGLDPLTGTTATEINPEDISGVTVLWEQGQTPGKVIQKTAGIYDISYSAGYVTFIKPNTDVRNTACVAIYKDGAGGTAGNYDKNYDEILWSWLIWSSPEPGTVTHNGKTFMDRNLGASLYGLGENYVRGFLFQWGRKDAFSAAAGDASSVYWFSPIAADVFTGVSTVESMAYTIAHPTTRIACWTSSTHSWMPEAEYSKSPWRVDVKTIYDPCPPGWKVPKKEDMDGITGLPATGLYSSDDPGLRHFGNADKGYYWTSTISADPELPANAWAFKTGENLNNWSQAEGYAIRPVRE